MTQTKTLPKILSFTETKYYIFSAAFVGLAVFVPWVFHQFHLAGPQFLPMHFFVLMAGFLFGWRTGLLVGALSPLMSYSIAQLPPLVILPHVVLELAAYGLVIGLLREKGLNIWFALMGAMILGRLARLAFAFDIGFIQMSWPGILMQLALIPVIIYLLQRFIFKKENEETV